MRLSSVKVLKFLGKSFLIFLFFIFLFWYWLIKPIKEIDHQIEEEYQSLLMIDDYQSAIFSIAKLNKEVQTAPTEQQKVLANQKLLTAKNQLEKQSKQLDQALQKDKKRYHDAVVNQRIDAFINWKNQQEPKVILSTDLYQWDLQYFSLQDKLNRAINKVKTGYEDPQEARDKRIMALVPAAVQNYKKHPNNKVLCTVMQAPIDLLNEETTAAQIAFFQVGDKYCNQYYSNRSSWGSWGIEHYDAKTADKELTEMQKKGGWENNFYKNENELNKKYGSLSYTIYYQEYIIPNVPQGLQRLKDKQHNYSVCAEQGHHFGARNPTEDALQVAYRQAGRKYCSIKKENGFYSEGVFCLEHCDFMCMPGEACDCVERCKETPGVLFHADS